MMSDYRKFKIEYDTNSGTSDAFVEIHRDVFAAVDDEWRSMFYPLHTDTEIVAHIATNVIGRSVPISKLDGFADLPANYVRVLRWPSFHFDLTIMEIDT